MGRKPVRAADGPGFFANRAARPFSSRRCACGERVAEPDRSTASCAIGGGYRMGPFKLMDLIGIDVNLESRGRFTPALASRGGSRTPFRSGWSPSALSPGWIATHGPTTGAHLGSH